MIISDRFMFAVEHLKNELIMNAPFDTGNLALNSIRIQQIDGKYHIVIGGEVAPYAVYTNEKWNRGQNPNESWVDKAITNAIPQIRNILSGNMTQEEYEKDIETQRKIIKQKLDSRINTKEKKQI